MYKNYLYLLRAVKDSKHHLVGSNLKEIYTQEKDKLFLRFLTKNFEEFHIVISTNPQSPFFIYKPKHAKAKKNVKYFFNEFLPDEVTNIEIAELDRIIKITFKKGSIYFSIKGPDTNVFYVDAKNNLYSFKKVSNNEIIGINDELSKNRFTDSPEFLFSIIDASREEDPKKEFKFIDKDLRMELDRMDLEWKSGLKKIIKSAYYDSIYVFLDSHMGKIRLLPECLTMDLDVENFDNYHDALNKYFSLYYSIDKDAKTKNDLLKFIENELEKISHKLNNIKSRIESGDQSEEYYSLANLALSNLSEIQTGMKEIKIEDPNSENLLMIKLDPKLNPSKNVDRLFERARNEKINFEKSQSIYTELKNRFDKFISYQNRISNSNSLDEILILQKELKIKKNMQNANLPDDLKKNFRHFLIDSKYHLYVGKDSKNNDLLTTKFAKQNDIWFHARSVSGSHVVLRVENTKESIPKNILKKAASVAAFYSKAKTSKLVPVSYTFKKYVVKKKGLDAGQVILLKEDVLLVTPEIPNGCESFEEDIV